MKRFGVALLPLTALLFAFGCQQGDKDKKDKEQPAAKADIDLIQGTWKVVSAELNGETVPADKKDQTIVISSKDFTWKSDGKESPLKPPSPYKLYSAKSPKEIDLEVATKHNIQDKKISHDTHTQKGLYELDGDSLKICMPMDEGAQRPTEFTAKKDSKQLVWVLKRAS